MATDDSRIVARPHSAADLDEVFGILSHQYRRTVIGELEWGEQRSLDDLVALLVDEDDAAASTDVRVSLVHNHLPRMQSADVITYDDEAQVVELDDAVAERTVLAAIHGPD